MNNTIKNQNGGVNSIEFIIYFTIIVFIMFSGVDYYVAQTRYSILEQLKERSLDRMRIEGWLSESDQDQIITKLEDMGYSNIEIEGSLEGVLDEPITRNVVSSELSIVSLAITAKPKEKPFLFGGLVGAKEDGEFIIKVRGEVLSERPLPN